MLSPLRNVFESAVPLPSLAVATVPVVKLDAVKFVKALPFAAGSVMYNQNGKYMEYWKKYLSSYQDKGDKKALAQLVGMVKTNKVTLYPYNLDGGMFLKYKYKGPHSFIIVTA